MKIYTKTGDHGTTGLIGGQRVSKSDPRIECSGSIDELNAAVGFAAVGASDELLTKLRAIQNELFVIGSHINCPDPSPPPYVPPLEEASIGRLEMEMDNAEEQLEPLRDFILPGGSETSARLHLARTICRRAERTLTGFAQDRPVSAIALTYLNRLSDWLFMQARLANRALGIPDVRWEK
jgi:cob(I)alamin adenosyltransferase